MNANRPNFTWPVLVIGVGIIVLLINANALPEAYGDLLVRAWPVLLIMFGLNVLLGGRIRYANWVILGLSVGLTVVIANFAYAERSDEYRDDYRYVYQYSLPENITGLFVNIEAKDTRVALTNSGESGGVEVRFVGSTESTIEAEIELNEDGTATFRVIEERSGILPRLSEVGRGTLTVALPYGVFIQELNYAGEDGSITIDATHLSLRILDATVQRGNMQLCLPERLATEGFVIIGNQITIENGDLRIFVPDGVTLSLVTNRDSEPDYIPSIRRNDYNFLFGGELRSQAVTDGQYDVLIDLNVDGGLILDHAEQPCQPPA